jgi:hypothetical protein
MGMAVNACNAAHILTLGVLLSHLVNIRDAHWRSHRLGVGGGGVKERAAVT